MEVLHVYKHSETKKVDFLRCVIQNQKRQNTPWPHIQSTFTLQTMKKNSSVMRCHMCLPKHVNILADKNSASNFRKHIAVSYMWFGCG